MLDRNLQAPLYTSVVNPQVSGDLDFVKKGGVIAAPPLVWPEVGKINFTAALQNGYLGSSLTSPGPSDTVLFYPHHFVTELVIKQVDSGGREDAVSFPVQRAARVRRRPCRVFAPAL